ncbi:hypothetical protein A45J_2701 [hot springs metagenome]|uniref:Uncharacterized protein n=1 Tax=hot springs metagenome TaxID=433727 RepID=A0A5J4L7K4_9ZZZZ
MSSNVKRYLALTEGEEYLLQRLLIDVVHINFLMYEEYIALNSLRKKLDLPEIDGITTEEFINRYSNCFKQCECE